MKTLLLPLLTLATAALTGCSGDVPACRVDTECSGTEICAYGTCETMACNADDECNGRICRSGICAAQEIVDDLRPDQPALEGPCRDVVIEPFNGSEGVSPLAQVRVSFGTAEDAAAAVVAVEGNGDFRTLRDGAVVVVIPIEPLEDGATYTARVTLPCGEIPSTFSVLAPKNPRSAIRASWTLQTSDMLPLGMRTLFTMLNVPALRLGLDDAGGMLGYERRSGEQDTCEATIPLNTRQGPSSVWSASGVVESLMPSSAGLRELHIRAVETAAGPEIAAYAEVDGRKIAHWLINDCTEGSPIFPGCVTLACNMVSPSLSCEPCSDGGPYCFKFSVHGVATPNEAPAQVTTSDVCNDPQCGPQPECR